MNKTTLIKIGIVIGACGFVLFFANKFNTPQIDTNGSPTPKPTAVRLVPYTSPTYGASTNEIEECEKNGGDWGVWGLIGKEYCQYPAKDAGKACADGSECSLGKCISENNALPGTCQKYPQTFGCFSYIENGKLTSAICID